MRQAMNDLDRMLTPEEIAAPTFLEWSDATLARSVRNVAVKLYDEKGFYGITGVAAAIALERIAHKCNAEKLNIEIGGVRITACLDRPHSTNEERKEQLDAICKFWIDYCRSGHHAGVKQIKDMANVFLFDNADEEYRYLLDKADEAQEAYEDAQPAME